MPETTNTAQGATQTIILKDVKLFSVGVLEEGKSSVRVDIENNLQKDAPAIRGYVSVKSAAEDKFLTMLEDALAAEETVTVSINEVNFADSETGANVSLIYINPYTASVTDLTAEELKANREARAARFAKAESKGKQDSEAVKKAIAEADAKLAAETPAE